MEKREKVLSTAAKLMDDFDVDVRTAAEEVFEMSLRSLWMERAGAFFISIPKELELIEARLLYILLNLFPSLYSSFSFVFLFSFEVFFSCVKQCVKQCSF